MRQAFTLPRPVQRGSVGAAVFLGSEIIDKMARKLIEIEERMYSVASVARLTEHKPEYILRLIESGDLEAIRPANPRGGKGQWRIYPESIRQWLGVQDPRAVRRGTHRAKAEAAEFAAIFGDQKRRGYL